jgi:predicted Zn-dependent protease
MRRGFVSLFMLIVMLFGLSVAAMGQPVGPYPNHWFRASENMSLMRADGTSLVTETAVRQETGPSAISFRHLTHRPNKSAVGHFSKAIKAMRGNRAGEALDRLSDAVRLDPEFFEAHLHAGLILIQAEAPGGALPHLEQALSIDSSSQAAQALSAWALLKLGRHSEAELALRRSMQLGRTLPIFEELLQYARNNRGYAATTAQTIP